MLDRHDLRELERILRDAALRELLPRFRRIETRLKADGSLLTEADLQMQARLTAELARRWPQFPLLGEEMSKQQQHELLDGRGPGLWVLDPLDGTSNFASGIPFFGISLAFLDAQGVQAGVVLDPMREESFSALRGEGAWLNGEPLSTFSDRSALRECMAMVDFKRLPDSLALRLSRQAPYRSQRSFGSVALDWCWVAASRVQLYLHGGQKLWDYAAGSLILSEARGAGGLYRDYEGNPIDALILEPRIAMAATDMQLFGQWQEWIRG